jgi:hypothetical protein
MKPNFSWIIKLIAAVIWCKPYILTSAAEESVYILPLRHRTVWYRIGSGIVELIASILISMQEQH